jgi:hypothetical protein
LIVNQAFVAQEELRTEERAWRGNAYNKSISSEGKGQDRQESGNTRTGQFTSTAGGVRQGLHLDTQKTEFRFEKSGQSSVDQRL